MRLKPRKGRFDSVRVSVTMRVFPRVVIGLVQFGLHAATQTPGPRNHLVMLAWERLYMCWPQELRDQQHEEANSN